ncbi:MAG: hypothetical protein ISS77_07415 [Phycisphaerae bacterium]|nr:hypothetical protein [Phycisphaerae bacterium]
MVLTIVIIIVCAVIGQIAVIVIAVRSPADIGVLIETISIGRSIIVYNIIDNIILISPTPLNGNKK